MPLNNDDEHDDGDDDDNTEDDDDDIDDDLRKVKFWDCPLLITQDSPATPHLINRSPIFQLVQQEFAKK